MLLLENISYFQHSFFVNMGIFDCCNSGGIYCPKHTGGHYIHRKRQFRLEQAVAIEENPYLYKSKPGKERNLMIPIAIMQLESIEAILKSNNTLTEEKKKQVDSFRDQLTRLSQGSTLGGFKNKEVNGFTAR